MVQMVPIRAYSAHHHSLQYGQVAVVAAVEMVVFREQVPMALLVVLVEVAELLDHFHIPVVQEISVDILRQKGLAVALVGVRRPVALVLVVVAAVRVLLVRVYHRLHHTPEE
jgi:hypothetical protein